MTSQSAKLRVDVERIWRAGVAAVLPATLIPENVCLDGDWLAVGDEVLDCRAIGRIAVVGAGKAAGAMAVALEKALGSELLEEKQVNGWVNVPADCVRGPLEYDLTLRGILPPKMSRGRSSSNDGGCR